MSWKVRKKWITDAPESTFRGKSQLICGNTAAVSDITGLENSTFLSTESLVVLRNSCPLLPDRSQVVFIAWLVSLGTKSPEAHDRDSCAAHSTRYKKLCLCCAQLDRALYFSAQEKVWKASEQHEKGQWQQTASVSKLEVLTEKWKLHRFLPSVRDNNTLL